MQMLAAVNDPGKPGQAGDDRYGFDEGAGVAWALDGATDVTDLRPFPRAESGAAWFAEKLSGWLLNHPPKDEPPSEYWRQALLAMRETAARETAIPLDSLPLSASPIAAGIWMRVRNGEAHLCWLGDCVAFIEHEDGRVESFGKPDHADDESAAAAELLKLPEDEMWAKLAEDRARQNSDGRWIFGLNPEAAAHVVTARTTVEPGMRALLMTDGLYRIINPYKLFDEMELMRFIRENGLSAAIEKLRAFEAGDPGVPRVKARDDACAVYCVAG